jgi:hypothetical protein
LDACYLQRGGANKGADCTALLSVRPINKKMNLFTIIFRLLGENKNISLRILDGYEDFSPSHQVNFKDLLDASIFFIRKKLFPAVAE